MGEEGRGGGKINLGSLIGPYFCPRRPPSPHLVGCNHVKTVTQLYCTIIFH